MQGARHKLPPLGARGFEGLPKAPAPSRLAPDANQALAPPENPRGLELSSWRKGGPRAGPGSMIPDKERPQLVLKWKGYRPDMSGPVYSWGGILLSRRPPVKPLADYATEASCFRPSGLKHLA